MLRKILLAALSAACLVAPARAQTYSIQSLPSVGTPSDNDLLVIEHIAGLPGQKTNTITAFSFAGYVLAKLGTDGLSIGSVTTAAPGTSAAVSISGAFPNQVLNFTIPQGANGTSGTGAGNVNSTGSIVNGAPAVYADTTGNLLKSGTLSGIGAAARGVNNDITALNGLTTAIPISEGGTGQSSASSALAALGGAPLASPALTGTPTAPTQATGDNSTKLATTAFVVANGGGSAAPAAVDARSSAFTVPLSDKGKVLQLTGSFNVTSPAATANFYVFISKHDGSGVVTFTPASGTIDGLSSISIYQENFLIWSDGTNWWTQNRQRGWINIGTTAVSSPISAATFTTGFADPELLDMRFDISGVLFSSGSDFFNLQYQKAGSTITSGYTSTLNGIYGANNFSSSGYAFSFYPADLHVAQLSIVAYPVDVIWDLFAFAASSNQRSHITTSINYNATSTTGFGYSDGMNTTSGAVTGISVSTNSGTGTFTCSINQRGFRQ